MNSHVTYLNNIYGTVRNKIRTTKPPVLILISSNKNFNDNFDDVIPVNDISTYNQDVVGHVYLKESPPPQLQKNTSWYKVT